jgi:hypothetical protein
MEDGEWKMEGGGWKMEDGESKVEGGEIDGSLRLRGVNREWCVVSLINDPCTMIIRPQRPRRIPDRHAGDGSSQRRAVVETVTGHLTRVTGYGCPEDVYRFPHQQASPSPIVPASKRPQRPQRPKPPRSHAPTLPRPHAPSSFLRGGGGKLSVRQAVTVFLQTCMSDRFSPDFSSPPP